jgi:hypothetical protein
MVVELLGYNPRAMNLIDVLYFFGNCLTTGIPGFGDFLDRIDNMEQVAIEDYAELYAGDTALIVRGQPLLVEAPRGTPLEVVFRMLVPEHRDLLLADTSELRRRIPTDVPRLMTLDEWHQPPLWDVDVREHETLRMLAEVLASGDTGRYQPTLEPNTHWSNWPEAGTL